MLTSPPSLPDSFPRLGPTLALILFAAWATPASAFENRAGDLRLGATLGAGGHFGDLPLDAPFFHLGAAADYALSPALGVLGVVQAGLSGTSHLALGAGVRYRITGLELPLSPFGQALLTLGPLFTTRGATVGLGIELGAGAEYFLTADIAAGALLKLDLGGALGRPNGFHGTAGFLLTATYRVQEGL